eukprot:TRINITY_DN1445_c0_g1_i1.p1 TRINITY_DN1445_c0_g1~~TRINITY_DN1445_c0_g1_i1.p1  ORF type:complete len:429 (-),score=123.17 TRINITY_DN1445_c0_g1_i1:60-1346(-)
MKISNYQIFLSERSKRRKPSPIREIQPLLSIPGMISLGGGTPNPSLFPFDSMAITLKDGTKLEIPKQSMEIGLQYSPSYGIPDFVNYLKNFLIEQHDLKDVDIPPWDLCVTTGSQDAQSKAFDLLLNEGDYILVENPTYSGALAGLQSNKINPVGVDIDSEGLIPEKLEEILSRWDFRTKPLRALYTIPTGQNPSGTTLPLERKRRIYEICSKYDLIIMEDDPYYHLRLPTNSDPEVTKIPSFLSMDIEGRVLRFDSFSKVISAGLRIGWVAGPKELVERIQLDQQSSALHPSGMSQILILELLKSWGTEGWEKQILKVRETYAQRRDFLMNCAEKYLKGLAEWYEPSAGMFLWFKLNGVDDTRDLIVNKAMKEKVLFIPGSAFSADSKPSPYIRASYSTASFQQMEEAIKRLASLLQKEAVLTFSSP